MLKGVYLVIQMHGDEYKVGMDACKNHLQGGLLSFKGGCPLKLQDLQARLEFF